MKIQTKLCYESEEQREFKRLGIQAKNKEKYKESDFTFDITEVTGIDSPTTEEPDYFVIFLKGSNGLLIKHNYKELIELWNEYK